MESRPGAPQVLDRDPTINPRTDVLDPADNPAGLDTDPAAPKDELLDQNAEALAADEQNRYVDREILGKSVQVKLDIQEKAQNAVSRVDRIITKGRNILSMPKTAWRKRRLDRAESSLKHKNKRLQEKHQGRLEKSTARKEKLQSEVDRKRTEEQLWVDSASSTRLREKRQQTIDAKHARREAELKLKIADIDSTVTYKYNVHHQRVQRYEQNVFTPRKDRYEGIVGAAAGRTERTNERKSERMASVEKSRETARGKKELATARKELRRTLRGPENKASRRETNDILDEIFGNKTDAAAQSSLRELGRKVVATQHVESQFSYAKWQGYQIERQTESTRKIIERAQQQEVSLNARADAGEAQLTSAKASLETMTTHLDDLRAQGEEAPGESVALMEQIDEAKRGIAALEKSISDMREQAAAIPDRVTTLRTQLAELQRKSDEAHADIEMHQVRADVARQDLDDNTRAMLNSDTPKTDNTGGA